MSAFIVHPLHIQSLVRTAYELACQAGHGGTQHIYGHASGTREFSWQQIADELMLENVRSVNYRYHEENEPDPVPFIRGKRLACVSALKALDCLEYQCSEPDDWRTTWAFALCAHLRSIIIRALPGYEDSPWGIDSANVGEAA